MVMMIVPDCGRVVVIMHGARYSCRAQRGCAQRVHGKPWLLAESLPRGTTRTRIHPLGQGQMLPDRPAYCPSDDGGDGFRLRQAPTFASKAEHRRFAGYVAHWQFQSALWTVHDLLHPVLEGIRSHSGMVLRENRDALA